MNRAIGSRAIQRLDFRLDKCVEAGRIMRIDACNQIMRCPSPTLFLPRNVYPWTRSTLIRSCCSTICTLKPIHKRRSIFLSSWTRLKNLLLRFERVEKRAWESLYIHRSETNRLKDEDTVGAEFAMLHKTTKVLGGFLRVVNTRTHAEGLFASL